MTMSDRVQNWSRHLDRMVADPDGRKLLADKLDVHFVETETSNRPLVAVLVPSYGGIKPEAEKAITRMIAYSREQGIAVYAPRVIGHGVIHWVRNDLIKSLYDEGVVFTHALFIDDDISPAEDDLVKLLSHGKDIVAALSTKRSGYATPTLKNFDDETGRVTEKLDWKGQGGLIEVDGVGTGVMLLSKHAIEATAEFYLNCGWERRIGITDEASLTMLSQKKREQFANCEDARWKGNGMWFQFLPSIDGTGEYGEDISFCWKARCCGIPVYVDTTVMPYHWGLKGYSVRDFFAYKRALAQAREAAAAAAETEEQPCR